jgi:hypothetical protein
MLEVGLAGGCKKIKPLTDDEIFDIVLEKVRVAFPRINTTHLNSKGTKEELTTERVVDLLQIQESEVGLSAKRIREEVKVNFTGGFSGHSYTTRSKISAATRKAFPMEATTAHHGRGKSTAKATGGERASKARASKAKVEMAGAKAASRARAVENTTVAERGNRSTTAPFVQALIKARIASPRMQSRM